MPDLPRFPAPLWDGEVQVGPTRHLDLPLPFSSLDAVRLQLEPVGGDIVVFLGAGIVVRALAESRYVEDLPAEFCPDAS